MTNDKTNSRQLFDVDAKPQGLKRLYLASQNSARALQWLFKNEAAFKQECAVLCLAVPVTFLLNITLIEQIILLAAILFVILCEIVNTAIEVIVDRISLEIHPLSGLAKDLGSAVVSVSILLALLVWTIICIGQ